MTTAHTDLVTIGKIERPFGVRGEFKVRSLSDVPGRLDQLKQIQVLRPTGQMVDRIVTTAKTNEEAKALLKGFNMPFLN